MAGSFLCFKLSRNLDSAKKPFVLPLINSQKPATGASVFALLKGQALSLIHIYGQKEIISFYRSSTSGEYMIYVHKRQGDDYVELGHAKGYGRYLKEVSYPRCQNNGARAIALSWGKMCIRDRCRPVHDQDFKGEKYGSIKQHH